MLTIEELPEVQGERMPTVTLGNNRRGTAACNRFDKTIEQAADRTDDDVDGDAAHFHRTEQNSHRCHQQLNPEEIADLDLHHRQTNRSY